ncbi:T9SS type A sorting domain-containing protein [Pontibacter sp. MBLB2868]|uniref:T9SS type A sorting domain-containing protein n=1 Tax=Pontibacter sp. MBLB2868 TaxID=3451555 RepID=UPI003F751D60
MKTFTYLKMTRFGCFTSLVLTLLFLLLQHADVQAQKYWRGGADNRTATDWNTAANWQPAEIPGPNDDVFIGDAGFDEKNYPDIPPGSVVSIKSLTVGVEKSGKLLVGASDFSVNGNVTIGAFGEFENHGSSAYYSGNFVVLTKEVSSGVYKNGVYKETGYSSNPGYAWGNSTSKIWPYTEFIGTGKTILFPSSSMGFSYLKISGSVKMLSGMSLIKVNRVRKHKSKPDEIIASENPKMYVSGTFDPMGYKVAFDGTPTFVVEQTGTIYVKAVNYKENYAYSSTGNAIFPIMDPLGTVSYNRSTADSFSSGDQNVLSSQQYGVLSISGTGVKTLEAPVGSPVVQTSIVSNLLVESGTLDIIGYTLNRTSIGGTMSVSYDATLKLSGISNFPANFSTVDLKTTSTTIYYGAAQNVQHVPKGYGNLHLIGSGAKTMPNTAGATMVIAGNLLGEGSASFTATADMAIAGNVTLGNTSGTSTASFDGSSFTHTVGGDWTNNADFTGNTSTVRLIGTGKVISRTANVTAALKNEFNNLEVAGLGTAITIPGTQTLVIKGNLSTTGAGTLTQSTGSLTMEGAAKTISGNSIVLNDFIANGSTTTTTSFTVKGNFTVNSGKSFVATGGTITMAGDGSKNIINSATSIANLTFYGLRIDAKTLTSSSFYVDSDLSGNNLTAATAGTVEFRGATATFAGTHNLFKVVVSGTDRRMVTNSNMGVASTLTVSGNLNVTANIPNTVTYNGTIAQTVAPITYHHLVFDKTGAKKADNALTVNGNLEIKGGSNFNAGDVAYTHNIYGNWIDAGTFTAGTGTIVFAGNSNTTITGATTFNDLKILKDNVSNFVSLNGSDITTNNIYLTTGFLKTGATNRVIVLIDRYDTGWVEGTITRRLSSFNAGTSYLFNGPYVAIKFGTVSSTVTEISVTSNPAVVNFPGSIPVNRLYKVVTNGSYSKAQIQLQYEDSELNGNKEGGSAEFGDEDGLKISYSDNDNAGWSQGRKNGNNYTSNWVSDNGIDAARPEGYTDLNKFWVISDKPTRFSWDGDVNKNWEQGGNWLRYNESQVWERTLLVPSPSDIAELGREVPKNQPHINSEIYVKGVQFFPNNKIVLSFDSTSIVTSLPALNVRGNIVALETGSIEHVIKTANRKLETNSSLILDNINHRIHIRKTSNNIIVTGNVVQSGASINIGSGFLKIKGDYSYTSGAFTTAAAAGTVVYEGGNAQTVANVPYYHLNINKSGGVAQYSTSGSPVVKGNLTVTAGTMLLQGFNALTVNGNIIINVDGVLNANTANINAKGDWTRATTGKFIPGTGTVSFIGTGAQNLTGSVFNNLVINNGPTGYAKVITSDATINGDLTITSGKLLLSEAIKANRSAAGGVFEVAAGASLELKGADNFPSNFNTNTLASTSKVLYSGTIAQKVRPIVYGKLALLQGQAYPKTLDGASSVLDSLILKADATFNVNNQTLTLHGHFVNDGIFLPGFYDPAVSPTGTLILARPLVLTGTRKNITGKTLTVNNMIISVAAMYNFSAEKLVINGSIDITGNGDVYAKPDEPNPKDRGFIQANIFSNGFFETSVDVEIAGDFKNSGMLFSNGKAKFLGGRKQTIQLLAPIIPYNEKAPTVEFAGDISPILNSTRSPEFADVIISNTAGVTASVGWGVAGIFTITPNAKFFAGSYTHKLYSAFLNYGIFESSGVLDFSTPYPFADAPAGHPFKFGSFTSTGTLKFGGTGQILLSGSVSPTLNNLIISNSKGITTTTLSPDYILAIKDWKLNGSLIIESTGKLNAIPEVASKGLIGTNFFIKGDITNQGYIISVNPDPLNPVPFGIGANFTIEGSNSSISGSGTTMLGNLTVAPLAKLTINKPINIYSSLTHNGLDFNSANSLITFIGAGPSSIISGVEPVTPLSLGRLQVFKDTQPMFVNLETDIDKVLSVTVAKGTLDLKNKSIVAYPDVEETTTDEFGNPVTVFKPVETILTVVDGATVKVGGDKTLPDVDVTTLTPASNVIYYGGKQEVKNVQYGNLRLENTLGLDKQKTFLPAEGTTKIAGSFVLDKTPEKVVTRSRVTAPATIEYNGGDQQIAGIDYNNLSLTTGGAKTLNDIVGVADAFTNTGAATVDAVTNATTVNYNGTVAQDVLPLNYHHLQFNNTGVKTLLAGETGIAGDFTVTTPSTNLAINATTVNFNGDRAQKVAAVDYDNLRFSVKGKKTITGTGATVNVKNSLLLSTGSVSPLADNVIEVITGSNKIVLNQASGTISEGENAYVTGFVETQRTMTTALENFGGLGIEITPTLAPGLVTIVRETGRAVGPSNNSILRNYSFVVADVNSKLDARVTFHYFTHELNTLTESTLQLFNSLDGVKWYSHPNSIPNETSNDLIATGVPTLRRMTLASTNTPLPVELIYFKAEKNGSEALLTWETATEEDNKGFGIEVSEDGFSYREIGFVSQGTGTTRAAIKYTFKDIEQGKNGMRYYRLRQQDFDGKVTYYGPRTLAFEIVKEVAVYAYPNPFQSNLTVNVSAVVPGQALVEVYNVTGQKLVSQSYQVKAGVTSLPLSVEKSIAQSGIYFVTVEINGQKHRLKVVRK